MERRVLDEGATDEVAEEASWRSGRGAGLSQREGGWQIDCVDTLVELVDGPRCYRLSRLKCQKPRKRRLREDEASGKCAVNKSRAGNARLMMPCTTGRWTSLAAWNVERMPNG